MRPPDASFLHNKSLIVSSHHSATGFIQHLEEYVTKEKIDNLLAIEHPLNPIFGKSHTEYRYYRDGSLIEKGEIGVAGGIEVFNFVMATLINIWLVVKSLKRWDVYIGSNNLNTFAGIWLRRLGLVKKVVFYTVDFVPKRFPSQVLNSVYHWVDKFGVIHADEVWILSPRMRDGRKKYLSLDKKYDKKQILVPEGVWVERIEKIPFDKCKKHTAVFIGHIVKRMGVQIIIEAIPYILMKIPDFKFIIIGKGEYKDELVKLTQRMRLEKYVDFKGYIEDHKTAENIIASCGVGIATYTREDESGLTFYADPAKTKLYLGAGIPVVMTDTFYNAYEIENAGGGKVIKEFPKDAANAIISIIGNYKRLQQYRKQSLEFAKEFDYPVLLTKHLKRIFRYSES